jgi:hypothetical protein
MADNPTTESPAKEWLVSIRFSGTKEEALRVLSRTSDLIEGELRPATLRTFRVEVNNA